jgi:hypothetical protein
MPPTTRLATVLAVLAIVAAIVAVIHGPVGSI